MALALKANDKYRATLRSTWIASPADSTLAVTSIPTNVPTIVTVGWQTDYETVFKIEGTSGTTSADYALTGVTRLKGANANIPENTAVNCLNHEEYFNQYTTSIDWVTGEDGETITFDLEESNRHIVTLGGNRTLAVENATSGFGFILKLVQDETGSRTVTWWDNITWAYGVTPTLTTTGAKADVFAFLCTGGGETPTFDGFVVGQNL